SPDCQLEHTPSLSLIQKDANCLVHLLSVLPELPLPPAQEPMSLALEVITVLLRSQLPEVLLLIPTPGITVPRFLPSAASSQGIIQSLSPMVIPAKPSARSPSHSLQL